MRAAQCIINRARSMEAPVLVQEMRIRQRGAKPFWVMFVYVLLLSAAALLDLAFSPYSNHANMQLQEMSHLGREIFQIITMVQLVMIILIVPAYSSSSVVSERERGSFELLVLTLLSSGSIVRQKLFAAIGQVTMLMVASIPVVAIVFLLGGVSPAEMATAYGILVSTAILLSAIGMLCSCCLRNSRTSTFVAYLIPILVYIGLPICYGWLTNMGHGGVSEILRNNVLARIIIIAIIGAIPAFAVYSICAAILSAKTKWWRIRAFRIGVFGAVYIILLVILSNMPWVDKMFHYISSEYIFVVNPFYSLEMSFDSHNSFQRWTPFIAMAINLGFAFIFERISTLRLNGLRRTS